METAIAHRQPTLLGKEADTCLVLLERNNQDLLQLKKQLQCYTCEPKTYSAYEQYVKLTERLETAFTKNLDIIHALERKNSITAPNVAVVKAQILEFNELKRGVLAYRASSRNQ
ncbi:hypothetical protein U1E44_09805 [Arenibacter sp. GZD96]|uniref:hypothetical protein n=1 Tax=Aurantibrevibacter litoralis TaxID=3106030 RepID=UPI002AFFFE3C|nr:hypothetical protein [Arenibacter sp. GZD-96]MEA1786385.1 hypothetical protein [Arenibacter sp. GZD-96]